jgi:hypothetical protein
MINKGYRIPDDDKSKLGCKFDRTYWEDVAGDGGSRMQMFDCIYDGNKQISDKCEGNNTCAAFEPQPTTICQKHDIEYIDYCELCYPDIA